MKASKQYNIGLDTVRRRGRRLLVLAVGLGTQGWLRRQP